MARINQSAVFTLRMLEELARRQPVGVSTLARELGIPKSNVQRALATLEEAGWIRPDSDVGSQWVLGYKVLSIARQVGNEHCLRDLAVPQLELLSLETGETVGMAMRDGDHWVIVEVREGSHPVRAVTQVGVRMPLEIAGTGHLILAYLPEEERNCILDHRGVAEPQRRLIRERIVTIRRDGFAYSKGEMLEGVAAVVAPIFDTANRPVGTVGITVPSHRVTPVSIKSLGARAVAVGAEITRLATALSRTASCATVT